MSALISSLWPLAVTIGLAVMAVLGLVWKGRREGAADQRALNDAATLDRISAGHQSGAKAAASGKTSEQILRENDGGWQ